MPIQVVNVRDVFAVGAGSRTIKILVVGPPGAGKTLSASTWPDPLYADIEGRLLSVRDRDVHRTKIDTVSEMEELKAILIQKPDIRKRMLGTSVKTVVIDTVDELARMIIKERLISEKIEAMRMNDWGYLGDQLRGLLRGFRNLEDLNVVFNSHMKSTEDSETGRVEKKPDISGAVGNEIAGYVDLSVLIVARPVTDPKTGQREVRRHLQTYPDAQHDWVKDHSGTLPMEFPVNFKDDYQRLSDLIFGVAAPVSKVEVKLDTSASIAEPEPEREPVVRPVKAKAAGRARVVEPERKPEPEPASEPAVEVVPEKETELVESVEPEGPEGYKCSECGVVIENADVAEISEIRFGVHLCREHFVARRKKA